MGTALVLGVGLFLALSVFRGWRMGPVRQFFVILAIAAACGVGFFGGRIAVPVLRPVIGLPDFLLAVVAGVILGLITFLGITIVSGILFRKTADQESSLVRFGYGVSGAALGMVSGLLLLWIMMMAFSVLGTVARARVDESASIAENTGEKDPDANSRLVRVIAQLKDTMEQGRVRQVVEKVDVVPEEVHELLSGITKVAANSERARRFMEFPGASKIARHPIITRLSNDPDIQEEIRNGGYLKLLNNRKVIEAANDPGLAEELKKFELKDAIDYALNDKPQR